LDRLAQRLRQVVFLKLVSTSFGTTREEIIARFAPHFALVQDWVPRSYPNRTGRERMFWWRR
jgi:hypothetical protein